MTLKDFIAVALENIPEGTEVEFDLCVVPNGGGVDVNDRYPDAAPVTNRLRFKLASTGAKP